MDVYKKYFKKYIKSVSILFKWTFVHNVYYILKYILYILACDEHSISNYIYTRIDFSVYLMC